MKKQKIVTKNKIIFNTKFSVLQNDIRKFMLIATSHVAPTKYPKTKLCFPKYILYSIKVGKHKNYC